ncbi:MAG: hypothetical protein IPP66_23045 [Anaerolineales bacterium]|nr:hypothetical protein [Anaerolineales bacterium]
MKKSFIITSIIVSAMLLLTQLQPAIIYFAGAVAGTFGVRPVSHQCFGLVVTENDHFPPGEVNITMILFHFRYSVSHEDERPVCVGQDIWYGE